MEFEPKTDKKLNGIDFVVSDFFRKFADGKTTPILLKTMNYPLISEYVEAVKSAEDNFKKLKYLRPVLDADS